VRLKKDELIDMLVEKALAEKPSFLDVDAEKDAGAPPTKKKRTTELRRLNWGKEEEGAEVLIGSEGQGVIQVVIMHKGSCKKVSGQVDWNQSFGASGLLLQSCRVSDTRSACSRRGAMLMLRCCWCATVRGT
jgi:hypothetical protein